MFVVVRRETLRLSRDGNFSFSYGCFTVQNSIFQYIVMYIKHLVTIIITYVTIALNITSELRKKWSLKVSIIFHENSCKCIVQVCSRSHSLKSNYNCNVQTGPIDVIDTTHFPPPHWVEQVALGKLMESSAVCGELLGSVHCVLTVSWLYLCGSMILNSSLLPK